MRITESRLRRIIRSVIKESYISNRTPEQEEADILDRFPDPYSMPELGVKDVKFLLGLEHNESKALTYIPKFLRKHFGDGTRTGFVSIIIEDLIEMEFTQGEIDKIREIAGKVFRHDDYEVKQNSFG
tara:strand:- start:5622 stop:6002 length:381 start_codon:yes stop_codon:yes gene_type:complete